MSIPAMFINAEIQRGEAELSTRIAYASHALTHKARIHRKQGVWAAGRLVCAVAPGAGTGTHHPILTTYNQDRLHNHKG